MTGASDTNLCNFAPIFRKIDAHAQIRSHASRWEGLEPHLACGNTGMSALVLEKCLMYPRQPGLRPPTESRELKRTLDRELSYLLAKTLGHGSSNHRSPCHSNAALNWPFVKSHNLDQAMENVPTVGAKLAHQVASGGTDESVRLLASFYTDLYTCVRQKCNLCHCCGTRLQQGIHKVQGSKLTDLCYLLL